MTKRMISWARVSTDTRAIGWRVSRAKQLLLRFSLIRIVNKFSSSTNL